MKNKLCTQCHENERTSATSRLCDSCRNANQSIHRKKYYDANRDMLLPILKANSKAWYANRKKLLETLTKENTKLKKALGELR